MRDNFYCQQKCGEQGFSIEAWNEALEYCIENDLSEKETDRILNGDPCESQCFDCMAIVGETREKNKKIRQCQQLNNQKRS